MRACVRACVRECVCVCVLFAHILYLSGVLDVIHLSFCTFMHMLILSLMLGLILFLCYFAINFHRMLSLYRPAINVSVRLYQYSHNLWQ